MVALSHTCDLLLAGYEAMSDGVLITDPNLSLLFFNQSGKDIFRLDESLLNKPYTELLPNIIEQEIRPEPFLELVERIKTNPFLEFSQRFSCLTGDKWLETKPLLDKNRKILGRIWIISEISGGTQKPASSGFPVDTNSVPLQESHQGQDATHR